MMRRAVRVILMVIVAFVALVESVGWAAVIAEDSGTGDRTGLVLAASVLGLVTGSGLHVVVHELGHLRAAKVMRLRVIGVRMWRLQFGAPGVRLARSSGHVLVDLRPQQRALPARMGVFVAAGPVANVAVAAMTAVVATTESVPLEVRVVTVGFTVAGLVAAILNLVPHRLSSTSASDGLALLRWVFRPSKELARTRWHQDLTGLRPIAPRN
jgi:hypothetical protein